MKLKDVILAIAIMILSIFVTFYGINTIFPKQQYEDFCGVDLYKYDPAVLNTEVDCVGEGGRWYPQEIRCVTEPCPQGYCDLYYDCNKNYEDTLNSRARKVFFIALPLGIVLVILGAFIFGLEAVGLGIMGGGIGTLIYGSGAYWPYTENWVRFLLSLIGLAILVWATYHFTNKDKKKRK